MVTMVSDKTVNEKMALSSRKGLTWQVFELTKPNVGKTGIQSHLDLASSF